MGSRHDYAINGMFFAFFGTGSGVIDFDWRSFFKTEDVFSFSESRLAFLTKQFVPSLPNLVVDFWSLKGLFKTWQHVSH